MPTNDEILQNLLKEVKSGTTYVMSGRESNKLFPPIYQGNYLVMSTEDKIRNFAGHNGILHEYDINFNEWSFYLKKANQSE